MWGPPYGLVRESGESMCDFKGLLMAGSRHLSPPGTVATTGSVPGKAHGALGGAAGLRLRVRVQAPQVLRETQGHWGHGRLCRARGCPETLPGTDASGSTSCLHTRVWPLLPHAGVHQFRRRGLGPEQKREFFTILGVSDPEGSETLFHGRALQHRARRGGVAEQRQPADFSCIVSPPGSAAGDFGLELPIGSPWSSN